LAAAWWPVPNDMKTIQEVAKRFKTPRLGTSMSRAVPKPYELSPREYLDFATTDLKNKDLKAAISATNHIKAALYCRVDELLLNWGFFTYVERQKFDYNQKIKLLSGLGVFSPLALKKVNSLRKFSETDYPQLTYDIALDYFTVVDLFVDYTDSLLKIENEAEVLNDQAAGDFVSFTLDSEKHKISFRVFEYEGELPDQTITETHFNVSLTQAKFDDYTQAIKWWLKAIK